MDTPGSIRDIDRQAPIQRRIWLASRIAWGGMALVLALAAAGLFGEGWLASTTMQTADGSLHVAFDRFQRTDAVSEITVTIRQPDDAELCFDRDFLDAWHVETMKPAPLWEKARGSQVCHLLQSQHEEGPMLVRIQIMPRHTAFAAEGVLQLVGIAPVRLHALVWP